MNWRFLIPLVSLIFSATLGAVEENSLDYSRKTGPFAEEALQKIKQEFETLRLNESDFNMSPGGELPLTIQSLDKMFEHPLDASLLSSQWADRIEEAASPQDLLMVAKSILNDTATPPEVIASRQRPSKVPALPLKLSSLQQSALKDLFTALGTAQQLLNQAVDSVSPEARRNFMRIHGWPEEDTGAISQEISSRRIKNAYDGMKPFRQDRLIRSSDLLLEAIFAALPRISKGPSFDEIRWNTPAGLFLLRGKKDDVYTKTDLETAVVVIDLGGKNIYQAPTARAHTGEIRVVLDLGSDVRIQGDDHGQGNAGAGIFGIGILVLPNEEGTKIIDSGAFSQGFGMGGIGVLHINGNAQLNSVRYTQGCGIAGVGILQAARAKNSTYTAVRSGQGCGMVRGVGIFSHQGDGASIKGGLVQPDPREPLGSLSLCQGVGYGPRAYAGGGVGLAVVRGNQIQVLGSYFSQGCGYWRALGAFRFRGNDSTLQARRYDMGSGVHSAFGHFDLYGNGNRVLNWGVGPSHGWDHSGASAFIRGDENEIQVDWAMGMAQIDSLAWSVIRGDRNKLKLPGIGNASVIRNLLSYSIQIIEGSNNVLEALGEAETDGRSLRFLPTPWGVLRMQGTSLQKKLDLVPPVWPALPREEEARREQLDLASHRAEAVSKPAFDRISDWVDVASAFGLDKDSPREALLDLLSLSKSEVPFLTRVLEPAAVDQLIRLNVILPAYGSEVLTAFKEEWPQASIQKRNLFINMARFFQPSHSIPFLTESWDRLQEDRLRPAILRSLGHILNRDMGREPGVRTVLEATKKYLLKPRAKQARQEASRLLDGLTTAEAFGLLSTLTPLDEADRREFLAACSDDITDTIHEKGASTFLQMIRKTRKESQKRIQHELETVEKMEPIIRLRMIGVLTSTRTADVYSAVVALGQMGHPQEAETLAPFLEHARAPIREAAAIALARLGEAGLTAFKKALENGNLQKRLLVFAGLSQSLSEKGASLMKSGWDDPDPLVRLAAVTAVRAMPDELKSTRKSLVDQAKARLVNEPDASVRLAVALLE